VMKTVQKRCQFIQLRWTLIVLQRKCYSSPSSRLHHLEMAARASVVMTAEFGPSRRLAYVAGDQGAALSLIGLDAYRALFGDTPLQPLPHSIRVRTGTGEVSEASGSIQCDFSMNGHTFSWRFAVIPGFGGLILLGIDFFTAHSQLAEA
jgi:hypothetical protein